MSKCEWCKKSFVSTSHNTQKPRFCSQNCFALSEKSRRKIYKCEQCGNPFSKRTHGVIPRFCSGECWYSWQREQSHNLNPIYTCKHCAKPFARRYKAAKQPQFCSPKCRNDARRSRRAVHICRGCGKEFTKSRSDLAGAFCSRNCFTENKQTRERSYQCEQCSKSFNRVTWLGNPAPQFCSRQCASAAHKGTTHKLIIQPVRACKVCGKRLKPKDVTCCSRGCSARHAYEAGKLNYRIRGYVATIKRKGKLCCEKCGDENYHHLTVHHRDKTSGDDGLQTLCANCHYEVHWTDAPSRENNLSKALDISAYVPIRQALGS